MGFVSKVGFCICCMMFVFAAAAQANVQKANTNDMVLLQLRYDKNIDFKKHVDSYMKMFKSGLWNKYSKNEFEIDRLREESIAEMKTKYTTYNNKYIKDFSFEFSKYDFSEGFFPMESPEISGFDFGLERVGNILSGGLYVNTFPEPEIIFTNADIYKRAYMSKDDARALFEKYKRGKLFYAVLEYVVTGIERRTKSKLIFTAEITSLSIYDYWDYKVKIKGITFKAGPKKHDRKQEENVQKNQKKNASGSAVAKNGSKKGVADASTNMEFLFIKGGCYSMGSDDAEANKNQKPAHKVCVDDFWMGKYEVTQREWMSIMGENPSDIPGDQNPVDNVSWNTVQEFIKKLNAKSKGHYRLPTEAEWEYAARNGGKAVAYAGSDDIDRVAWYRDNYPLPHPHAVGRKAPNAFGVFDMSGNVAEWVQDSYKSDAYSVSKRDNPLFDGPGGFRVVRGGSCRTAASDARTTSRSAEDPEYGERAIGFRLVRGK